MALYKARIEASLPGGDTAVFGFWFDSTSGEQAAADAVADVMEEWLNNQGLSSLYTTNTTFEQAIVGLYTSVTGTQQSRADSDISLSGNVDEGATPPLPGDVCVVVSLETGLANRRGRGRFYMPAPATDQVTEEGRLLSAAQQTYHEGFRDSWNAIAPGTLVVASRVNNATEDVLRIACGDLFDTQRRRENALSEGRGRSTL